MACEKEEHLVNKNNEQLPQNPKDTVQNKFIFQYISKYYYPYTFNKNSL